MKILLSLLLIAYATNLLGSNNNTHFAAIPDEEPKSTVELPVEKCYAEVIDTCFFTTSEDCDEDGYPNWRWLVVDTKGEPPSGEAFLEIWLNCNDNYYLLATTDLISFPRSRYSLKVYGQDHLEGTVAVIVKDEGIKEDVEYYHLANSITIESPENDINTEVAYCQWSEHDFIDVDGDGYYRQHRVNLNINSCPISTSVYFKVSACKHPVMDDPCWYYTSPAYSTDDTGEILHMIFGGENGDLLHGEYQIDLQVFDAHSDEPVTDIYHFDDAMKFELPEEDELPPVAFSIDEVYMGDEQIDMDLDDYSRSRDLNFDANVDSGIFELTAKIFYKKKSEDSFHEYYTTPPFAISGSNEEYQKVMIGGENTELQHNIYDFKIQLFIGSTMVAEKLPDEDHDLSAQWFETTMEDEPFKMGTAFWSRVNDWDGDGHASYRELSVQFDVYSEPEPVYLKILSWLGDSEATIFTSEGFKPSISDPVVKFDVPCEQYYYGTGTVYLYRVSDDELINVIYGLDTKIEAPEDDMVYSLSSMKWTDSADYDMDGYYSYRKLDVDILAAPLDRTLKLEVSMCIKPIMAVPCPYLFDYYFKADSTDEDIISIELGLPNAELDSGIYQFDFWVIDSLTNEKVVGYIYVDDNLKMEPSGSDKYKFFINNVSHKDQIDMDGDLFIASEKLMFNVNVTGGTHSVYAMLYYRPAGETEFTEYYTTSAFEVTSHIESSEMITIGIPNNQFEHGIYDLKLVVFNADDDKILAVLQPENERNFSDRQYETIEQDAPVVSIEPIVHTDISVFPNPFDNALTVSFNQYDITENPIIRLYDTRGALVLEQKINDPSINSNITIDSLEELRPGIYILEIQSSGGIGQLLVVKR